jgi:hypothetical protein
MGTREKTRECPLVEFMRRFGSETYLATQLIGQNPTAGLGRGWLRCICAFPRSRLARRCFFRNLTQVMLLSGIRFASREPADCGELRRILEGKGRSESNEAKSASH